MAGQAVSASERLKALKALHDPHPLNDQEAAWTLRNALPQIVAVVEAAERAFEDPAANLWDSRPVGIALAALEEALS